MNNRRTVVLTTIISLIQTACNTAPISQPKICQISQMLIANQVKWICSRKNHQHRNNFILVSVEMAPTVSANFIFLVNCVHGIRETTKTNSLSDVLNMGVSCSQLGADGTINSSQSINVWDPCSTKIYDESSEEHPLQKNWIKITCDVVFGFIVWYPYSFVSWNYIGLDSIMQSLS